MRLPLDRDSPIPLYHQLAEALRWQVSTGRLAAGDRLPAVREAAGELGVNMHTVRRAYAALAEDGLVRSDGGRGTFVLGPGGDGAAGAAGGGQAGDELDRFLDGVARQAAERFGLAPADLGRRLAARGAGAGGGPPAVHVLECSESQCADHAAELAAAWALDARPWSLERSGEPPAGPLVATYFHYAEILRRWPHRRGDLHFVPIHVDPALPHRLARGGRLEACEMDEDRARNLQADLEALFPPGAVPVGARVAADPGDALAGAAGDVLCCFAPRAWARLTAEQQGHPRARKVRYVIEREALDDLGRRLGWARAGAAARDGTRPRGRRGFAMACVLAVACGLALPAAVPPAAAAERAAAASTAAAQALESPHAGLLRDPDVSATHVAFRYADDLWLVPREGGTATPLASPPGAEINPRFSPDGSTLAFVANYDGDEEIYTVPAAGGVPLRVTHQPGWQVLSDWTPDGRLVYFTGSRHGLGARNELFTVAATGGMPEPLPVPYGTDGAISPDGRTLAYVPNTTRYYRDWKRYVGGTAADVWLFGLDDHAWRAATDWPGTDAYPMWNGDRLYFLSDAGPAHRLNLWSYDPASGERRQLTRYEELDVRTPAVGPGPAGGGEIVYTVGSELRLLDLATLDDRAVEVRVPGARPRLRPAPVDVSDRIGDFSISPDGARVAVEARGDVWTLPAEHGTPRNLTRTSGVGERDPAWSPDGRWIAFVSDRSGEYQLHVIRADGRGEERRLTERTSGFLYRPQWSPDSRRLLFRDQAGGLWLHTLDGGETRLLAADPWARHPAAASWSPDGRWIAFDLAEPVGFDLRSIWLYDVAGGSLHRATSALADERLPAFDRAGDHLFYVARRALEPTLSDLEFSFVHEDTQVLAGLPLRRDVESPYRPRSDEAEAEGGEEAGEGGDGGEDDGDDDHGSAGGKDDERAGGADDGDGRSGGAPEVRIDLESLERRAFRLPVAPGGFAGLAVNDKGQLLYLRTSGGEAGDEPLLQLFDLEDEEREEKTVAKGVRQADLAAGGAKLAARSGDRGVPAIHEARPGAEGKPAVGAPMIATIEPRAEWRQLFDDAWRLFRDFFYDPGMHGLDWAAVGDRYREWLPDVASRDDLTFVVSEMISELNVGHAHLGGGAPEEPTPDLPAGLLGADLELDGGAYRVARIYRGPAWQLEPRSPLAAPGVEVAEGDYLLAVDGVPLDPAVDPWAPFVGLAGHEVVLTVGPRPGGPGGGATRDVVVEPLDLRADTRLRYFDWVESNRRRVAEATGGRVGYLHVADYGPFGLSFMLHQLVAQRDAAALVVDQRFNGGGWTPDRFLELLDRPPLMYRARRDGLDSPVPFFAHFGPKCLLMNELSGSSADMFPWMFREAGLGPLIGTRTWGGVVGLSGNPALIDGQTLRIPNHGTYSADGRWIIEGWGVEPDVEVREDPSRMLAGEDPQLEAAIAEMLRALDAPHYTRPPRPPGPDRTGLGVPVGER